MKNLKLLLDQTGLDIEKDWNYFKNYMQQRNFTKNTVITKQNEVENYINFVSEGIGRIYHDSGTKQTTLSFGFAGEFFNSYESFLTRMPSNYEIDAVTDMKVWSITFEDLGKVYENTETAEIISRRMVAEKYLLKERREFNLLTMSPEEHYKHLIEKHPIYIQEIPLHYIASFIGVTPQALSRIRKRVKF